MVAHGQAERFVIQLSRFQMQMALAYTQCKIENSPMR